MEGYWTVTKNLRWLIRTTPIMEDYGDGSSGCVGQKEDKVLQQMWQCSTGEQEWKDIDVVFDYDL
ncbi:MAG: hypothetical protein HRT69_16105 [Flavobacteriaceae bacterium]|jgi:hypothetical protein|nr:hypothetical protein [Flavobacteriaceae bacterium]